jgi:hypothetical protein
MGTKEGEEEPAKCIDSIFNKIVAEISPNLRKKIIQV